ncbi:MAG: PQQ-binding-like beta-propeller repeat protein [Planctomycetota bacterium]|nr:PQQ-binding-like beta-propeller repeat protein [Planctomycetota bacterium]
MWRKQLGVGHSSFAISDGRLYTMGYDEETSEDVVYCLNPETGEEIWTHRYEADIWNENHAGGTLTTPSVDGDSVYTFNREGKLFRLDAATGQVQWSRNLQEELKVTLPNGASPHRPLSLAMCST